ncbi:MAG: TlpA family protein disulfide reductase [Oscillospiraceae bacterium]|jgi:thiol-disulfide isomerase/thioredoxin|nr:TlpA family protein disulfide reductase [Oscillospiraceae bacterium]
MSQRTKLILGVAGLAALLAGAALAYNALSKRVQPSVDPPRTRETAPDFTVTDAEGNSFRLSDWRGAPVVLNFWASWCPPCRKEMPEFDKAHGELGNEIMFLMVDSGETVEAGARFAQAQGYGFPVYFDTENEATVAYGISGIPATYFIDREGYIVSNVVGELSEETLRRGIDGIRISQPQ